MLAKMGYSGGLALLLSQGLLPLLVSENKACGISPAKAETSQSRRGLGSVETGRPQPKGFKESRSDGIVMVMRSWVPGWVAVEEACQSACDKIPKGPSFAERNTLASGITDHSCLAPFSPGLW